MEKVISLMVAVATATATISCKKPVDPHAGHQMDGQQPSGASLYQFHDLFTDQNGKTMMLHQLQGKIRGARHVLCHLHGNLPAHCGRDASP
jgi:hypothetical protein